MNAHEAQLEIIENQNLALKSLSDQVRDLDIEIEAEKRKALSLPFEEQVLIAVIGSIAPSPVSGYGPMEAHAAADYASNVIDLFRKRRREAAFDSE